MCVVPIAKFLEMTDAFPHQTLRDENVAVKFDSAEDAVFVSHQWCSKDHADPEFRQLSVLQGMFRHAVSGTLRVEVDLFSKVIYKKPSVLRSVDLRGLSRWFMWYDYFSVPQPEASEFAARERVSGELAQAVASLASYVTDCKLFIILAPFVKSVDQTRTLDYVTWKERGWCRFETLSSALSPKERRMVLVKWPDTIFELGAQDYLLDPVGLGAFSVVEDRVRLAPLVQSLLQNKLSSLKASHLIDDYRQLLSWSRTLEKGIGDTELMMEFVRYRADVSSKAKRSMPAYLARVAQQPMHVAALRGHASALAMLLEQRSDVDAMDGRMQTPLILASACGHPTVRRTARST